MDVFKRVSALLPVFLVFLFSNPSAQPHFTFTSNTGPNMTVLVQTSINPTIDGLAIASGDEIGVFTPASLCVGAATWTGSNIVITVWGDNDQTSATDGMKAGEQLLFRVWDASLSRESPAVVTWSSGGPNYSDEGIAILATLVSTAPPAAPLLLLPADGAIGQPTTPTLVWHATTRASTYHVQLSSSNGFGTITQQDSALTDTFRVLTALGPDSTWYWRLRAKNAGGAGPWSAVRSFTTAPLTYTVSYNANMAASGTVPVDANDYIAGATVTVLGNTGSLSLTGFSFGGWNTAANGSGTTYAAGNTFAMPSGGVTLYALWIKNQYTLTLNHSIGGAAAVKDRDSLVYFGDTISITAGTYPGTTFSKWRITAGTAILIDSMDRTGKIVLGTGNVTVTALFDAITKATARPGAMPGEFGVTFNSASSTIRISVPQKRGPMRIRILLYDLNGKSVGGIPECQFAPGRHEVRLFSGRPFPASWLVCRVNADGIETKIKIRM